jgi:4-hydroxymandelate synthase
MPGVDLNHVEFFVGDVDAWLADLVDRYAFTVLGGVETDEARSVALAWRRGGVVVLTVGKTAEHPAAVFVRRHDDGVADIAVRTDDLDGMCGNAVRSGATVVRAPGGDPRTAVISGSGDLVHTIVQRSPQGLRVPGFADLAVDGTGMHIDHFAMCVPAGELHATAAFYEQVFGLRTIFAERIAIGDQAMNSLAAQNDLRTLTFTMIEPDPSGQPGQIDDFLKEHGGAGIQHVALAVDDIAVEVSALVARGVRFLDAPQAYYDLVAERLSVRRHPLDLLRGLGILLDEDADGRLFQIFARSTHPRRTFFFEVVERMGARTFGSGNVKALYEAVEMHRQASTGSPQQSFVN